MSVELAIVGLGNPGLDYEGSRHNVGFEVLRRLADRFGRRTPTQKHRALLLQANIGGSEVLLVQPLTYMNRSGESLSAISAAYELEPKDMWVVVDDFQIPLGTLRIRNKGSHGGHNGLASIIEQFGTSAFPRFRLGIGGPPKEMSTIDFVLGRFSAEERGTMDRLVDHTTKAIEVGVREGLQRAAGRFNGTVIADEASQSSGSV